jgi:ABC-2 type transport system permease protein
MTASALGARRFALSQKAGGRLLDVVITLAADDVRLRYRGTFLGALWSVARPLALFGVLYLVFTRVVRFDSDLAHYPLYLLLAVVLWTHFSEVTRTMSTSLVTKGPLLRKVRFPRLAVPLAASLAAFATLGPALVVVIGFVLASDITPRVDWLQLVPIVLLLHLFATGVGLLLAVAYVRLRDVAELWALALQLLFYGSAVIYPVSLYPENFQPIAAASPLVAAFTQGYHALVDPTAPTATTALGGDLGVAFLVALIVLPLVAGGWAFARAAPRVAELV